MRYLRPNDRALMIYRAAIIPLRTPVWGTMICLAFNLAAIRRKMDDAGVRMSARSSGMEYFCEMLVGVRLLSSWYSALMRLTSIGAELSLPLRYAFMNFTHPPVAM